MQITVVCRLHKYKGILSLQLAQSKQRERRKVQESLLPTFHPMSFPSARSSVSCHNPASFNGGSSLTTTAFSAARARRLSSSLSVPVVDSARLRSE